MRVSFARRCAVTGQKLQDALREVESSRALNWGMGSISPTSVFATRSWINHPELVQKYADKGHALATMELKGVNVPAQLSLEYAAMMVGDDFPVVIRPRSGTRQGRGLWVVRDKERLERHAQGLGEYRIGVFEECPKEYRVHVIDGRVVKVQEKTLPNVITSEQATNWRRDPLIRTHRNGWQFMIPELPKRDRGPIKEEAKKAVRALGFDIGAVDVGVNTSGQPVVFEVNTAPGLWVEGAENRTFDKYVRWIGEVWGD